MELPICLFQEEGGAWGCQGSPQMSERWSTLSGSKNTAVAQAGRAQRSPAGGPGAAWEAAGALGRTGSPGVPKWELPHTPKSGQTGQQL